MKSMIFCFRAASCLVTGTSLRRTIPNGCSIVKHDTLGDERPTRDNSPRQQDVAAGKSARSRMRPGACSLRIGDLVRSSVLRVPEASGGPYEKDGRCDHREK